MRLSINILSILCRVHTCIASSLLNSHRAPNRAKMQSKACRSDSFESCRFTCLVPRGNMHSLNYANTCELINGKNRSGNKLLLTLTWHYVLDSITSAPLPSETRKRWYSSAVKSLLWVSRRSFCFHRHPSFILLVIIGRSLTSEKLLDCWQTEAARP